MGVGEGEKCLGEAGRKCQEVGSFGFFAPKLGQEGSQLESKRETENNCSFLLDLTKVSVS